MTNFQSSIFYFFKRTDKPRILAILLAILSFLLAIGLFFPLKEVFIGNVKVNQKIDLFSDVYIDFEKLGLSSVSGFLGLDPQYPIGSISLRFYSILMLVAVLSGYFLTLFLAKTHYISGTVIDRLLIGLTVFGILGSRFVFVLFNWDYYSSNPVTVISEISTGGLSFFGMLIFCLLYLQIYCLRYKFNFYEFLDVIIPGVLLGQTIGRWGNFFNYESYGPATSVFWKMFVPPSAPFYSGTDLTARYFHPTFLYEIIPNLLLLIIILYFYETLTKRRTGLIFSIYAIGYGIIRFFTEFFRLDSLKLELASNLQFVLPNNLLKIEYIAISQLLALLLLLSGVYVFVTRQKVLFLKKKSQEFKI